ncbi:VanZ family protein [Chitinilyticum piscinae]|uniref:VanZ family protein n=1 Tax=Chitinilyticum piscinae TaxID=2866724 RepID=A0A8J7K861_9NEIS|nr:VanZ family protein [Chitinilyticum piscinae]MBE9609058.1 VanZ family protein [Chitinilyticum piscinae]
MSKLPPISLLARRMAPTHMAPAFTLAWTLVLLIVSFYPFSEWHYAGQPLLEFYFYPLPYYFTVFDNAVNVLAYVPLGAGLLLCMRPRWGRLLLAVLGGTLLSAGVEFIQQFQPDRIASNLDIISNACGSLIGATAALLLSGRRWQRFWLVFRHSHFAGGRWVEWGLVWLVFWFITQFDPSQPFLGVVVEPADLPQVFETPFADPKLQLRLLEAGGVMLNLLGVALYVSVLMKHTWQGPQAMRRVLAAGLLVKLAFAGMLLKPAKFFAWVNSSVLFGALAGALLLVLLWRLQRRWRALLGLLSLALASLVSWLWPLSPQLSATLPLFRWQYGHLLHFNGLSGIITDLWPYVAMLVLIGVLVSPRDPQDI